LSIINGRVEEADSWTVGIAQIADLQYGVSSLRRLDLLRVLHVERENAARDRDEAIKSAEAVMKVYRDDVLTIPYDTEEQRADDLVAIDAVIKAWNEYIAQSAILLEKLDTGAQDEAMEIVRGDSAHAFSALEEEVVSIVEFNKAGSREIPVMSNEIYKSTRLTIVSDLVLISIFSMLVTFFLVNGIKRAIDELLRVSRALGDGDLCVSSYISSNDEFGQLSRQYNLTISHIKSLISSIQESAANLAESAEELERNAAQSTDGTDIIARNVEKVSNQLGGQRSEIESITSTIDEMAGGISTTSDRLDALTRGASESVDIAREGALAMKMAITQMDIIEKAVSTSAQVVTSLGERSNEIGRIVGTISDISSQTNLLALNAAIEAARAGEQGRGFAVVAEEVKKLAGESQTATEEISHLISSIQEETSKAMNAMSSGMEEVKKGSLAVGDGGRAFGDLADRSVKSADGLQDITKMVHQMSSEASGVVTAAEKVEDAGAGIAKDSESIVSATAEQAASMSEISTASQHLTRIASEMLDFTKRFSV
jgi:methyl-accepting chemotaxis protein